MSKFNEFNADDALTIVADEWALLRRCDVYRLFDTYGEDDWPALFARLNERRPALRDKAEEVIADIISERRPESAKDQPLDAPGYALRVAVLEATGMTTSDAQGVADAEFVGVSRA